MAGTLCHYNVLLTKPQWKQGKITVEHYLVLFAPR